MDDYNNNSKVSNSASDSSTTKSKNSPTKENTSNNSQSQDSTSNNSQKKDSTSKNSQKKDSTQKSTTDEIKTDGTETNITNNPPNDTPTNNPPINNTPTTAGSDTTVNNNPITKSNSTLPEIFSFEDVKKKYKDVYGTCGIEGDKDKMGKCPDDLQCVGYDYCELLFKCNVNDKTRCANNYISDKYFGACNTNEDCLSNSCVNNTCTGKLLTAAVGSGSARIGLELGEKCSNDNDCFENACRGGICKRYDTSENVQGIYGGVCVSIVLIILYCTYFCVFRKNKDSEK